MDWMIVLLSLVLAVVHPIIYVPYGWWLNRESKKARQKTKLRERGGSCGN